MPINILTDDDIKTPTRYHPIFIHNVFGHFFHDMLEYFATYLYPRFEWRVVSTYDKAVEYIEKQKQYNREVDLPMKPALILNPSGDFNLDESGHGARQPWRFINQAPGLTTRLFDPIYQDENMKVTPGFQRYKGDIEFLALCTSFYEYCDLRVFLIQMFTGMEKYIYPRFFNTFVILPQDLIDYEYTRIDGTKYKIDWVNHGAYTQLVRTTNKNELVFPATIHPRFKLMSMTEASTRLGGIDKLADWRLTWGVEYEIEIPTFLILEADYLAEGIDFEIRFESCYSANDLSGSRKPPVNRLLWSTHWNVVVIDSTTGEIDVTLPDQATVGPERDLIENTRYFHIVTKQEADSTADIEILLPEVITDEKMALLYSKDSEIPYGDYWTIDSTGTILTILKQHVQLQTGDILEIYVYKNQGLKP
jgi:hypothetical protein